MFRSKNRLLTAALAYATAGIPVVPPTRAVRSPGGGWACSCGSACLAPAAHPEVKAEWTRDPDAIRAIWTANEPPNICITSGEAVALWRVPLTTGAYAMRLFEHQRPAVWHGDWIIATAAPTIDAQVFDLPHGVSYLRPAEPVLAPPSILPDSWRRLSWRECPAFPTMAPPATEPVLAILQIVDRELRVTPQHY